MLITMKFLLFCTLLCLLRQTAGGILKHDERDLEEKLLCAKECLAPLNNIVIPYWPLVPGEIEFTDFTLINLANFTINIAVIPPEVTLNWETISSKSEYMLKLGENLIKGEGSYDLKLLQFGVVINPKITGGMDFTIMLANIQLSLTDLRILDIQAADLVETIVNEYLLDIIDILSYLIGLINGDSSELRKVREFSEILDCINTC